MEEQYRKAFIESIKEEISSLVEMKDFFKLVVALEPEDYLYLISEILSMTVVEKGMHAIYISYTRPSGDLNVEFQKKGIENIYFIDCITAFVNPEARTSDKTAYIQSPTAFEEILIKINKNLKSMKDNKNNLLIFDSITTASIYMNETEIKKMLHTLFNTCSIAKCGCIILAPEIQSENAIKVLAQSCGLKIIEENGKNHFTTP